MRLLVTGGAGFIGSAVVRRAIAAGHQVTNVDVLTYAADPANLAAVADNDAYAFEQADICDAKALTRIFAQHDPDAVLHLAAESHVDRSIAGPAVFVRTNLRGTYEMLAAARAHRDAMAGPRRDAFRFLHVSTDEVYGSVVLGARMRAEDAPYAPSSPYAATKAGADHMVRAWGRTYGLPVIVTASANNYGPYQFPEKLIPLATLCAVRGQPIPLYGDGTNLRDWIHVDDHADALLTTLIRGRIGETYNIGGGVELSNIALVHRLCAVLDDLRAEHAPHADLITFAPDRPGHDFRYALDTAKIGDELQWRPRIPLEDGLRSTVLWYLGNPQWWRAALRRKEARRSRDPEAD